MKALVLDANASAAVAVVQSLGREGLDVHAVAPEACLAHKSRYVSQAILRRSTGDPADLVDWMRRRDASENYALIVPTAERSLRTMQLCADDDPLRRKAVLAPPGSIEVALDKVETWELARRLGIPVPDSYTIDALHAGPEAIAYPVVLKTTHSQVLREGKFTYAAACIARNNADREAFLETWLPYSKVQQQRYFTGRGWGVACLYAGGELRWHFAYERLHEMPLTGGASSYRRSVECPPQLLNAARMLLDELSWHGVAMVEFRVNAAGEFVLLEVNPRFWGSLALALRCGVNFSVGLLRMATGGYPGRQPDYKTNQYMRSLATDLEWMHENWRADHDDALLLTSDRLGSVTEWTRPLLGVEGWDHFDSRDIRPGLAQISSVLLRLWRAFTGRIEDALQLAEMRICHRRNLRRRRADSTAVQRLLFLCHGNICRSPLAEQLARKQFPQWEITSSGFHAETGRQTPGRIQRIARETGVDLAAHRSRCLTPELVASADYLIIMDAANYRDLKRRFPRATEKVLFLGMFCRNATLTIPDPLNLDESAARSSAAQIQEALTGLREWLQAKV